MSIGRPSQSRKSVGEQREEGLAVEEFEGEVQQSLSLVREVFEELLDRVGQSNLGVADLMESVEQDLERSVEILLQRVRHVEIWQKKQLKDSLSVSCLPSLLLKKRALPIGSSLGRNLERKKDASSSGPGAKASRQFLSAS